MKLKILSAAILLLSAFSVNAQKDLPKGSLLLGGDLSYASYTYKDANTNNKAHGFNISPSVGFAVKNNLFIGINAGVSFFKNGNYINSPYTDSTRYHSYSYGVYVRKYKPLKNNFYIFLQGNLGGSNAKRDLENSPSRDYYQKDMGVSLSLTPGVSYAINSKLQLEAGFNNLVGISYTQTDTRDNYSFSGIRKQTAFNAATSISNFNSQLYLGFRLLLQKKVRV